MHQNGPANSISVPSQVLASFPVVSDVPGSHARIQRFGTGLINQTFLVTAGDRHFVLQRVSPIFSSSIHENIEAVTAHLARSGLTTPRLLPAADRRLFVDLGAEGVWRLWNHIEGVSFDVIRSGDQARAAGELVGRFHRALDGFEHAFIGLRLGVHDTPRHLQRLRDGYGGPSAAPLAGGGARAGRPTSWRRPPVCRRCPPCPTGSATAI